MYSSLSSATHHIFFPPRLEVVVQKQDANRLSADAGDEFPLDRLLDDQTHGPAGPALGRVGAHHGNDPLLLAPVEHRCRTRAVSFIEGRIQSVFLIAVADVANGLGSE